MALEAAAVRVFGSLDCAEERILFIDGGIRELCRLFRTVTKVGFPEFALGIEERLIPSFPDWHPDIVMGRRRWLRLMLRGPNFPARRRVRPLSTSTARLSKGVMDAIDPAIRALVVSAREHGLPTASSCEGHHGNPGHLAVLGGRRAADRAIAFLKAQGIEPGFLSVSRRCSAHQWSQFRMATLDFWLAPRTRDAQGR
jgi:hypothetical protein